MMAITTLSLLLLLLTIPSPCLAQDAGGDSNTDTDAQTAELAGFTYFGGIPDIESVDVQQRKMEATLDEQNWSSAELAYASGDGTSVSLQDMAKLTKFMTNQPYFELFSRYYKSTTYADIFINDALFGDEQFSPEIIKLDDARWRGECANKGSQYIGVWMYTIGKLEDAVRLCMDGTEDAAKKELDKAWAVYTGSILRDEKDGGFFTYTLAQKRASGFEGSINDATKIAKSNERVLTLFKQMQGNIPSKCDSVVNDKNDVVKMMILPVMQGVLRYVVKAKKDDNDRPKSQAEGWAFTYAILPLIDLCDGDTAQLLIDNFQPSVVGMEKSSIKDVAKALQGVYACLGFKCEDVGVNNEADDGDPGGCSGDCIPKCNDPKTMPQFLQGKMGNSITRSADQNNDKTFDDLKLPTFNGLKQNANPPGAGKQDDKDGSGLSTGGVVGIVIGVLVGIIIIGGVLFASKKRKSGSGMPIQSLGEEVHLPSP